MAAVPDPTRHQEDLLSITERVGSCLSLAGIAFIFATFTLSPYFKKSINRQIFYASIGNLGVTVAALISEDGPRAGQYSALCQFQGFLVQMFLGVDCFWSLCMAVNVYLIFFHKYTVEQLRSLDWKYLIGCYGASFVPAFVYIFVDTKSRGKVYGPAIVSASLELPRSLLTRRRYGAGSPPNGIPYGSRCCTESSGMSLILMATAKV